MAIISVTTYLASLSKDKVSKLFKQLLTKHIPFEIVDPIEVGGQWAGVKTFS